MMPLAMIESEGGFAVVGLFFWLWMIYECATHEQNERRKILWLLLVIFTPPLGPLIYFFVRVLKVRS